MTPRLKTAIKDITISTGLYGPARKTYRQFFNRNDLQQFRESAAFYSKFVHPNDLCFDVGSNVGDKAEVFLHLGARVVAFEPVPHCAREIAARCSNNPRLTVIQAAVGSAAGTAGMTVGKWDKISSLTPGWVREQDVKEIIDVPVTTLDIEIKKFGIPKFCKIDVEGHEMEVLRGLSHAIPALTLEYTLSEKGIQKTLDCIDYLSRFGSLSINITTGEGSAFHWSNWIDKNQFKEKFPIPGAPSDFGDIFIKIER
jgi:FkbM family methyltransferase